jgi:hypothetical protein
MARTSTDYIVVHCSATRPGTDIGAAEIDRWHQDRGWRGIGYHAVIRLDGTVEPGRGLDEVGAHCASHNRVSVGVCVVGGVGEDGKPACTITDVQQVALRGLLAAWQQRWPDAEVLGHRDLSPDLDNDGVIGSHEWQKACPSFDVRHWLNTGNAEFAP